MQLPMARSDFCGQHPVEGIFARSEARVRRLLRGKPDHSDSDHVVLMRDWREGGLLRAAGVTPRSVPHTRDDISSLLWER